MPDGGGHGQESLPDSGVEPVWSAGAVVFQGQLAFEGVEDRFDPLPHAQQLSFGRAGFGVAGAAAGWSDQVHAPLVEQGFELGPGEALVGQNDLAGGDQVVLDLQQRRGDVAVTSRSSSLGWARHHITGMPSTVVTR